MVYAIDNNGKKWIIPIEWKYTESYDDCNSADKSNEGITYKKEANPKKKPHTRFKYCPQCGEKISFRKIRYRLNKMDF